MVNADNESWKCHLVVCYVLPENDTVGIGKACVGLDCIRLVYLAAYVLLLSMIMPDNTETTFYLLLNHLFIVLYYIAVFTE